jgi:hypothetical protein
MIAVDDILAERQRQNAKWGEQNHPDGTSGEWVPHAHHHRLVCQMAAESGAVTWRHILIEEVAEAFAETDPARLREELVQVAAVALQWIEAIDRRQAP